MTSDRPFAASTGASIVTALRQFCRWCWASPGTSIGLLIGGLALITRGHGRRVGPTLEFHGGFATWFLRKVARGAGAMTLGHVIIGLTDEFLDSARDHERVHVRQYERWGPLFLPAYSLCALWLWMQGRNGYWDNPFEREAYGLCPIRNEPAADTTPATDNHEPEDQRQPE